MSDVLVDEQFAIVPTWLLKSSVSDRAIVVYAWLAATFDAGTEEWAGIEWIAARINKSEPTVKRAVSELVKAGALTRKRRLNKTTLTTVHRISPAKRSDGEINSDFSGRIKSDSSGEITSDPLSIPNEYPDLINDPDKYSSTSARSNEASSPSDLPAGFEDFWATYPRKIRKSKTVTPFKSAVKRENLDAILEGVKAWSAYWKHAKTELVHIPHPSTWLNGDDFLSPPPIQVDYDLFTKEEREQVLADASKVRAEDITRYRREGIYPYDSETLRRMGNS